MGKQWTDKIAEQELSPLSKAKSSRASRALCSIAPSSESNRPLPHGEGRLIGEHATAGESMKLGDYVLYRLGMRQYRCRIASIWRTGILRGLCRLESESGQFLFYAALAELEPASGKPVRRRRRR